MAADRSMHLLSEVLQVSQRDDHGDYEAHADEDFCHGTYCLGGYTASLIAVAAAKHSRSKSAKYHHPDVMNMQLQFLRPVLPGMVQMNVNVIATARPQSVLHVSLSQKGRDCIVGHVNTTSLGDLKGVTFDTKWDLSPPPPPAQLSELERNSSMHWLRYTAPFIPGNYYRMTSFTHWFLPRKLYAPNGYDAWITPVDSRNVFTNDCLGVIADHYLPFTENFRPESDAQHSVIMEIAQQQKDTGIIECDLMKDALQKGWTSPLIPATLSMTLNVKCSLPTDGVRWLFIRAYSKAIEQGQMDLELLIMDEHRELVAIGHQVLLIVNTQPHRVEQVAFKDDAKL